MDDYERINSSFFEGFVIWILGSRSFLQAVEKRWCDKMSHWPLDQELIDLGPGITDQGMAIHALKE